jgi:hypothetical protein
MAKANRQRPARVNFFDGQRVTESDLDAEQIHHRSLASDATKDFHASGIVRDRLFGSRVLFDTQNPGLYSDDENESSKFIIYSGSYDGQAIGIDRQPNDNVYGNRIEVQASDLEIGGAISAKVLLIGTTYSSLNSGGDLVCEVIEFTKNQTKLSDFYYLKIIAVIFNNVSGGLGRTEVLSPAESLNTAGELGKIVLRESEPLKVFARTPSVQQAEAPNVALRDFITSSPQNTIEQEIRVGLGTSYNFNELYFELNSKSQLFFEEDGDQTVSYGQKFLSKSNNIQRLDVLLSVKKDSSAPIGHEFDFSGEIVVSVHKLSTDIKCITDPNPDNLIDFDPEQSPIIELSYDSDDLKAMGIALSDTPQIISFDLSGTLIADPNIEPTLNVDEFYAFLLSRRGDNRTGTIAMEKAHDKVTRKINNGQDLSAVEQFGKKTTRFVEFDPHNSSFVDDEDSSLWFVVHTNSVEITDGSAYTDDGYPVVLPKTEDYVGSTELSRYLRNIDLKDVSEGGVNYVMLQRKDSFEAPGVHPRTGNFVNTRIKDNPSISVVTEDEYGDVLAFAKDNVPVVLAKVVDKNVKDAQDITDTFDKPGLVSQDEILLINPDTNILLSNLVGRIITPDTDCSCSSRYRIVEASCDTKYVGDYDEDGAVTSADIISLLNVVGNTINAETTERKILGGELDIIDFVKSDLNGDGTVDGDDIQLIEDAVEGSFNFSVPNSFSLLRIRVENISSEDNFPEVFNTESDGATLESGVVLNGQDVVSFSTSREEEALAIREGDLLAIPPGHLDSGTYLIYSKIVDETGLGVTVGVTDLAGDEIAFAGGAALNISVVSGTSANMLADNLNLSKVPFLGTSWIISHEGTYHKEEAIDVCDLRRYVETNFIEEYLETCKCDEDACIAGEICSPQYRNQKVLANDLFLPNGEIYSAPGIPYHGDIEYASISIPLPPGSLEDCSVDLYTNFIKSDGGSCKTASGYPAMLYSDGTYVGCEDSGGETDITKGRVKIDQCIASLYVDAFVDGYMVDGYADEAETYTASEIISEAFIDHSYPNKAAGFSEWVDHVTNENAVVDFTDDPGPNVPVYFHYQTINAGHRYGEISHPAGLEDLSGDFVIDFVATRNTWPEKGVLLFGQVSFSSVVHIVNNDGTETYLSMGWRQNAFEEVKLFFKGTIYDSATDQIKSDFNFDMDAPDDLGDYMKFRLRRVDEAVFAMFYDRTLIDEVANLDGQFTRIGGLPDMQPGSGDAKVSFKMAQDNNPSEGVHYTCILHDVVLDHEYVAETASGGNQLIISRDNSDAVNRATVTFPILLTRRTNIISATLSLTAADAINTVESFNIIPYDIVNADNLGTIIDYPLEYNHSFVTTFTPGELAAGESVDIDVTSIALYFLSQPGHLPGFYKAISIEPSAEASPPPFIITTGINLIIEYEDITTGVVFKVGSSVDPSTGIVTLHTKNILYDSVNDSNRTVLNFGVHLKKSGFRNKSIDIGIKDLARIGIGTCLDETAFEDDELCFFIAGSTATGTFVEGPFPCYFHLP